MRLIAAVLVFLALLVPAAQAERRVALVVGNGAYARVPALANPRADAEAMAAALERLGFEVELGVDLDLAGMRRTVQAFSRRLEGADVALFFYAGHGLQVYGQNYLLPVDAALETEADLDFSALPARLVLSQMERWPGVKIVMLDACRDNPFATALKRSMGASRAASALSRGLAPIETAGGTLLAYATDPGDVAADGDGRHSPFTEALLRHVETPGLEINTMLARVRAEVYRATGKRQRPWAETSLIGEFYMAPEKPDPPPVQDAMMGMQGAPAPEPAPLLPPGGLDPRTIELALWEAAQAGGTMEDYEEYLRQYPKGIFARLARNRLSALRAGAVPGEDAATAPSDGPRNGAATGAREGAPDGDIVAVPDTGTSGGAPVAGDPGEAPTAAPGAAERAARDGAEEAGSGTDDMRIAAAPPAKEAEPTAAEAAVDHAAAEAALGLGRERRREIQARLLVAGHDPRGVDGVFGPGTRAALSAWQAAAGLESTGYLDRDGLARLERSTDADYAVWVERQRREAEARRAAAAERARAARERAESEAILRATRETADEEAAAALRSAPPTSAPAPAVQQTPSSADARSPRERYEQECYFVFTGKPTLERRCK